VQVQIAHDNDAMRGKRAISGGRPQLRHVMSQIALVISHHYPVPKTLVDRLRTAENQKIVTIAKALIKSGQKWKFQTV
jgi:transposase